MKFIYKGKPGRWVALVILAALVVWAIWQSKREVQRVATA
jgi:hypothetical protein